MYTKNAVVNNQVGLHARPATFFIQKANEFKCSIWVEVEERRVNAKSLLGVLSLGIVKGTEITLIANAFRGIKLAVGLLILNAGLNMLRKTKKTGQSVTILICAFLVMLLVPDFSALSLMILAGVISLALSLGKGGRV